VEKPETAEEASVAPAKAGPLKEPPPPDIMPEPEPPRAEPEKPKEPEKAPEKPAQAPDTQATEGTTVLTKEEFDEMTAIGRLEMEAHKMYQEYFLKKERNGTQDKNLLESALAVFDRLIPRIEKLLEKHPKSTEVEMLLQRVVSQRRDLVFEK
jgi:hypothetical protein